MAMVAASGSQAYHMDPLISSDAVPGASMSAQSLDCKKSEMARMVRAIFVCYTPDAYRRNPTN